MGLTLSLFDGTVPDLPLSGVSIDSRTARPGELFAAVRGERFDGHDFIAKAVAVGCVAVLAERQPDPIPPVPVVIVADVIQALGQAAQTWRDRVAPLVVAVTGSCGKTTVKEMLYRCLQRRFSVVHATRGNFNNHIGLPLTLLAMPANCQAMVVELGMSAAGEIAYLAQLARPRIGIVTNVLPAHLEAFASVAAIAAAKGELLEALPADGVAIIPNDTPYGAALRQQAGDTLVVTFGLDDTATVYSQRVAAAMPFVIHWGNAQPDTPIRLACYGEHIQRNVLAVAAAARAAGVTPDQIALGLDGFALPAGRGGVRLSPHGWLVVDDSYNANPGSVRAALAALPLPTGEGRRIAVLGDMLELGKGAEFLHEELCSAVLASGIAQLYTAGPLMRALHEAVTATALESHAPVRAAWQPDPTLWLGQITSQLRPGDVILVKGSRGMKMERIVENLVANAL